MKTNPPSSRGHKLAAVFLSLLAVCPAVAAEPAWAQVASPDHAVAACDQEELAAENRQLREQVAKQQGDIAALKAKLAATQQAVAQLAATQQAVVQSNEAKDKQIQQQNDVIRKQIEALAQLQTKLGDVSEVLIEERAKNRRIQDKYRRVHEQNKALLQQIKELKADAVPRFGEPEPPRPDPKDVPFIKGSVVEVDQATDQLVFVQLNIGSDDKVREGMEFIVYRGDQFVGKVKIDTVDATESVGKLTLGEGVKAGDKVRAGGLGKPDKPEEADKAERAEKAEKADNPEQADPPARQGPDE